MRVVRTDPTQRDTDADGLFDNQEVQGLTIIINGVSKVVATDPTLADTDLDGLKDGNEIAGFTVMINGVERLVQSDPTMRDTDSDTLSDGDEKALGTDPQNRDSDGDGLSDGEEAAGATNPTKRDTDGDGWGDKGDPFPTVVLLPVLLPLGIGILILATGIAAFILWRKRGNARERRASRPFQNMALGLAQITHGYLTIDNFHRNMPAVLNDGDDRPDQAKAEMYLRFYGFRRVQDQELQDDYPDNDLFYLPRLGSIYTFDSIPRSRARELGASVLTWWQNKRTSWLRFFGNRRS